MSGADLPVRDAGRSVETPVGVVSVDETYRADRARFREHVTVRVDRIVVRGAGTMGTEIKCSYSSGVTGYVRASEWTHTERLP